MQSQGGRYIKLVIIRHPETNEIAVISGERDAPSPKGLRQITHITKVCRREGSEVVVSSTMPRAATAAKELARELNVPLTQQANLQERNFGDWDQHDWPRISIILNKLTIEDRYKFKPPNGESWQEMEVRLRATLKDIAELGHDSIAIMTHAGCIRTLMPILGMKAKSDTVKFIPVLGECFIVEFDPASL